MLARQVAIGFAVVAVLVRAHSTSGVELRPGDILVLDSERNAVLKVDRATGDRVIISDDQTGDGPTFGAPKGLAVDTMGNVFVSDRQAILRVDATTGNREAVIDRIEVLRDASGMKLRDDRNLIVADNSHGILQIDTLTGEHATLAELGAVNLPLDVELDGSGDILVVEKPLGVARVSPITGDVTIISRFSRVGDGPRFENPLRLTVDESGSIFVVDSRIGLVRVEPDTGDRTLLGIFARDVERDLNGNILAAGYPEIFSFNPATGDRIVISDASIGSGPALMRPVGITVVPVPEPSTLTILAIGIVILMVSLGRGPK